MAYQDLTRREVETIISAEMNCDLTACPVSGCGCRAAAERITSAYVVEPVIPRDGKVRRKLTAAQEQKLVEVLRESSALPLRDAKARSLTYRDIGMRFGISYHWVQKLAIEHGIYRKAGWK